MNNYIEKKCGIKNAVTYFKASQFYLCPKLGDQKPAVLKKLKKFLTKQPGIKKVWTRDELISTGYQKDELEAFFKNQVHHLRSGDLICMTEPYCTLATHATGATHRSPYDYDTHVPLIVYQEGAFERKKIISKVFLSQAAPTLAKIMNINKPTASAADLLPEM